MATHRSSAVPLAWLYAGLVVYASLYPFSGWRGAPPQPFAFLLHPWNRWWSGFDLVSNLLGYLPLGTLIFGARVRGGAAAAAAAGWAVGLAALLSLTLETLQNFLPQRVPSNVDLALNVVGAACGTALGLALHWAGVVGRWQAVRERWFVQRSAGGLALLLLWPLGLLFPLPLPLGVGPVMHRLEDALHALLEGTALVPMLEPWLRGEPRLVPLSAAAELTGVALGLLAPCLVTYTVVRPGWRRLVLAGGALGLGVAAMTLSTALNFGPDHALAWRTPNAVAGIAVGAVLAVPLALLSVRAAAGVGLVVVTALVVVVAHAPADPYFADSLQAWEQGRFIRFHGAAQWVGWGWPCAVLVYLLVRFGARSDESATGRNLESHR